MTLVVRNEADIVATNIDYHLAQGVDFVIVTDHGSEDGTSEILRSYERMGVAKVIRDERDGHKQSERVTNMVELARLGHKADWIINNDADEFWWPLVGNLRDVFSSVPAQFGQIQVKRRNFRPEPDGEGPFYTRLVHRETSSFNLSGAALEIKVAHRAVPGVVVAPGNHSIRGVDLAPLPIGEVLEIFHFPMRNYAQFEHKVVQTGHGYEQLSDRAPSTGVDQLALLERHREGTLREYYDNLALDETSIERGLQMGSIVVDRRLEDFMRGLRRDEHPLVRPDAPFARALLRQMMVAASEGEGNREEIDALRAENEQASARLEQLQGQVDELRESLDDATRKLERATHALHLLHTSRTFRSTAWARRLYYRATGKD